MNKDESEARRSGKALSQGEYRTNFEIDKARLIHSEAFRRLQAKTQVLQTTESDFHRTRLTHSIEVAQIGHSIVNFTQKKFAEILNQYKIEIDQNVIEAICLAHDIGHPPFGHGGEIALNYMMRDSGGFEGNGQTLRILSKLGKYSEGFGMDLTRRVMLGVLKYPSNYSKTWNNQIKANEVVHFHQLNKINWEPPKCFFNEEIDVVQWILQPFTKADQSKFQEIQIYPNKNHETIYKSFDCSIMDLADDISYAIHDFEDGIDLQIFKEEQIFDLISNTFNKNSFTEYLRSEKEHDQKQIDSLKKLDNPKRLISLIIDFMIKNIQIVQNKGFDSPYFSTKCELKSEANEILENFKHIVWDNIIMSPQTQQIIKNGQIIICELFDVFDTNPQLLPITKHKYDQNEQNKKRIICDYLSGMTDRYALKTYKKIFGTDNISFFEK